MPNEGEVVKGGPGEGEGEEGRPKGQDAGTANAGSASPERVKVLVGDREIEVDAQTAEILEAQQRSFEAYQRRVEAQLRQTLSKSAVGTESDSKPKAPPSFYDDPEGFLAYHFGEFEKRVTGYVDKTLARTEAKDREREFWEKFYGANKDLAGAEVLVNAVYQSNLNWLADLRVSEAMNEIARLARAERDKLVKPYLKSHSPEGAGGGDNRSMRQIVAGAGIRSPGGGQSGGRPDSEGEPATLSQVLKARREQRRRPQRAQ